MPNHHGLFPKNCNVIEARVIYDSSFNLTDDGNESFGNIVDLDYFKKFMTVVKQELGSSDIIDSELEVLNGINI